MAYQLAKRLMDIVGALLGLAFIAPFAPLIALAIKLESRGPVLVRLPRVSAGRIVAIYKFRSMVHGAHAMRPQLSHLNERHDGPFFKIANDPRLTRVGRILRKLRIDEFPQLWNVLRGDLALVGPRPHEPEEVIRYPAAYTHLLLAKAGATGLSQVSGASSLSFLRELELDGAYVERQSLWLDAKIIARTVAVLFADPTGV